MSSHTSVDISKYITCRENCPIRYLEALAMNGFAEAFEVEDCDRPRFKRIILKLIDGSNVISECRFDEEVRMSVRIIASYIGLYRFKALSRK